MYRKLACAAILLYGFALAPPSAGAQGEKKEAEERFHKGLAFIDEGDYKKAIVEFEEAYKIMPVPVILYNMALCYDNMHKYAMAMDYYKKYLEKADDIPNDQLEAIHERVEKLETFLGTLNLSCNVDGASVAVDGIDMGTTPLGEIYLETGPHSIVIEKEGYRESRKNITIVSGKALEMEAELHPAEDETRGDEDKVPAKRGKKKLKPAAFWGTLGAALALGAGAAVVGGLNVANHNEFDSTDPGDRKKLRDLKDKGTALNAAFLSLAGAAGAAAVAAVVVGVFTDFKKERSPEEEKPAVGFAPLESGGMIMIAMPMGNSVW